MKIIKLIAEDVKGLKAVEITPDGSLVEIAGENGAGKSSVLDAIWLVLGGGVASKDTKTPLREGAKSGFATLVLSDMIATRKWTETTTTIRVTSLDGKQVFSSPQSVLDALRAKFLDPGHFIELNPKAQRQAILDIADLGIDLDAVAGERKQIFDDRTEIGRQGKSIGEVPALVADVPEEEVSAAQILSQMRSVEERNREIRDVRTQHDSVRAEIKGTADKITELQAHLKTVQIQTAKVKERVDFLGDPQDTDDLETQLAKVEDTNRAVRENLAVKAKAVEKDRLKNEYEALTAQLDALDKSRDKAISEANLPLPELGFTDDGITLGGRPFSDSNDGEQMIAALEIAAAFSPELRVIQMRRASLLDKKNFQIAVDFAEKNDYQIWMETVGEGHGSAILIEDGQVA